MASSGTRLVDKSKVVVALHATTPSSSSPKWISFKGYNHVTAIVSFKNATTVTGSAITLQQATDVSGTSAKALAFDTNWGTADDSSSVALTKNTVSSNTFTCDNTNSKTGFYIIEVDANTLDMANGFDCFQVACANATAQTLEITYILGNTPRYAGEYSEFANPLAN